MAIKKSYYVAPYTEFVVNPANAREEYDIDLMIEKIKAVGGVKVPGFVFPSNHNIDGKRVFHDGNTRLLALQQLAEDKEYLEAGGSLEFPYIILPEEVASDPDKVLAYQYNLGTSNKQLNSKEQAKLIVAVFESKEKKLGKKSTAVQETAKELGLTIQWVNSVLKIQSTEENKAILSVVDDGVIGFSEIPGLIAKAEKHGKTPQEIIELAQISSKQRGANKVTRGDVLNVDELLEIKNHDLTDYVKNGIVPFNLIVEIEEAAKNADTDINGIIKEATDFKEIESASSLTAGHIRKAAEFLRSSNENLLANDSENVIISEIDEEIIEPVDKIEQVELAKDAIDGLINFLTQLVTANLNDDQIIILGKKAKAFEIQAIKFQTKNESIRKQLKDEIKELELAEKSHKNSVTAE